MWPEAGLRDYPDSYPHPNQINERELKAELQGKVLTVTLKKHVSGFGFRIMGGDLLGQLIKISSINGGSVANRDGRLQVGDILVRVNGISVLTYSRRKVADLIQSLPLNSDVEIEICREYPLPVFNIPPQHEKVNVTVVKGPFGFGFSLGKQRCEIHILVTFMVCLIW